MKDPTDRLIMRLVVSVVFMGIGALFGSIKGPEGALLGAFCGLMVQSSLYLQSGGPFQR